ncbi:MAG: MFS transporter [Nannocystaceae bacterium]
MPSKPPALAPSLVTLFAVGAGLAVAALYYAQPLLASLSQGFGASAARVGMIVTLTQLGYGLGILTLAPLGDRYDRRKIIIAKSIGLVVALVGSALAPSLGALLVGSLAIGVTATLAQDIVPAAATMASDAERGRVLGKVMTGLLLGILLSRVISGFVAEHWGWRSVYFAAAAAVAVAAAAFVRWLPRFEPTTTLPYGALLRSLSELWRSHPLLRQAVVAQALLSLSFSAFWSTLALVLEDAHGLGPTVAGAFGLAGAAGAIAAPLAGRMADRRSPGWVARGGALLATASFAAMALDPLLPGPARLGLLVLTTIAFDFGVQASLVGHQTLIYSLDAPARSRLNALLLAGMFLGMAVGTVGASALYDAVGWLGVVGLATLASLGAWALRRGGRD